MSGEEDWLLPSIGPLGTVKLAIAGVRRAMGYPRARPATSPRAAGVAVAPMSDFERDLWGLVTTHAKISALLLQLLEQATAETGTPVTGETVLQTIVAHQQAHSDLAGLDDGLPFDA